MSEFYWYEIMGREKTRCYLAATERERLAGLAARPGSQNQPGFLHPLRHLPRSSREHIVRTFSGIFAASRRRPVSG